MKQKLLNFIKNNPRCSFSEIEKLFIQENFDYSGEYVVALDRYENLFFWNGWNSEALNVFGELLEQSKIALFMAHPLEYFTFGKLYTTPIAKRWRSYKKEHWMPVVVSVYEKEADK